MRRQRFLAAGLGLAAVCAMAITACGGSSTGTGGSTSANCVGAGTNLHLVVSGQLTIASDTTYAPAEFLDANQQPTGYDVDLVKAIAAKMCLTPKVDSANFNTIITDLAGPPLGQQRWDMSISSFSITTDREKKVNFIPYFIAGESTLVAKGNPDSIQSISDMCGKTVSAQNNTIELAELQAANGQNVDPGSEGVAQQPVCKSKPMQILSYDSEEQVIEQVISGRAVAAYQDQPVTDYYISLHQNQLDRGYVQANSQGTEGIVVRKDNTPFQNAVQTALNDLVSNGKYMQVMTQWGQQKLACLPNCPPAG
jgi:polar amino acid transport system substrate-binding protein